MKLCLSFLLCSCLLSACNTINGVGKDIERAGEAVQDATK